jgi:pilus assembly protein Flp/PilA
MKVKILINNPNRQEEKMFNRIINFFKDEEGATAVEYGIMVAAIAAVIITIVIAVGNSTNNAFDKVNTSMQDIHT